MSDEELSPELRQLVDLAREGRTPGESDKRRIAERLAVPLAAGVVAGSAAGTAKAAGASVFSSWAVKLAAVVAVGAAGTLAVVSQSDEKPPPTPSAQTPAPPVEPAPLAPPTEAPLPISELPQAEPTPAKAEPPSAHSAKPAHELAQEAALLHEAQAAWRAGQSAEALKLANQHAQRFPKSQLANERDVLRVLSLCKLGQAQAAKQVGARLLRQAKGSPWYQSVAESCAGK